MILTKIKPGYAILSFILIVSLSFAIATTIVNDNTITTEGFNNALIVDLGDADDIQTKINSCSGDCTVIIPSGNYAITSTIAVVDNLHLKCDPGAVLSRSSDIFILNVTSNENLQNFTLSGCTFDGGDGPGAADANKSFLVELRANLINSRIYENTFQNNIGGGIRVGLTSPLREGYNVQIYNNKLTYVTNGINAYVSNSQIKDNYIQAHTTLHSTSEYGEGIEVNGGSNNIISGNQIYNFQENGIDVNSISSVVSNNYLEGANDSRLTTFIDTSTRGNNSVIIGNVIVNANGIDIGIDIEASFVTVANNYISGNKSGGIGIRRITGDSNNIHSNMFFELGTNESGVGSHNKQYSKSLQHVPTSLRLLAVNADNNSISGTTVLDASGNNYHGVNTGVTLRDDDVFNQVIWCTGDDEIDFADYGLNTQLSNKENWTFSIWFKPDNITGTRTLFASSFNASDRFAIQFHTERLKVITNTPTVTAVYTNISLNEWNHIVVSMKDGDLDSHLNGQEAASTGGTTGELSSSAGTKLCTRTDFTSGFNGSIANLQVWDHALTDEQKRALYEQKTIPGNSYVSQNDIEVNATGSLTVNSLTGSGNDYVCVDTNGVIYRNETC